jgi:Pregnancy-associated plasma protein-A/CARDB
LKKFTLLTFSLICILLATGVNAQKNSPQSSNRKCATDEMMKNLFDTDPQARARYENMQRMLEAKLNDPAFQLQHSRTQAITNVPVAVHIMIPNPALVTDATVQSQIDTLNWFYGNQSATDSLRVYAPFRTRYGRSEIRFCMAQRTPAGLATNGIERVTSNATFTAGGASPHPSTIVPAWDPTKYLNIWVVVFTDGTLGYSYKPGAFTAADQRNGFVNDYRAFGAGPSYLFATYNQGKTAVHEIGHFFNLNHTWGGGGSNPTCAFADGCSDIPPTTGPTFGTPAWPVLNTCSPAAPGIMIQNHMDYADDAAMCLFTSCQTTRMNTALTTAPDRVGLTNSNGCVPPIVFANDAAVTAIIDPVNGGQFCGTSVTPRFTLRNAGSTLLANVRVTLTIDGVPQPFVTLTPNLAANASTTITLAAQTLTLGAHTFIITTSLPNGVADQNTANDSQTSAFTIVSAIAAPLVEGFEGTTYPPAGWILSQVSGTGNWARNTAAFKSGVASAKFDNYNYPAGTVSSLVSPSVTFAPAATTASLTFHYAHRTYSGELDKLEVLVSTDCGTTWTSLWLRSGATGANALVTVTGNQTTAFTPTAAQWTTAPVTIDLTPYKSQAIKIQFKASSDFGNNLYIDDINIFGTTAVTNDAGISAILSPASSFCASSFIPSFTVKNFGSTTLTSVTANYRIDGSTTTQSQTFPVSLATNATTTVTFTAPFTGLTNGPHTIKAFTSLPNGSADLQVSNDTTNASFVSNIPVALPIVEGFEGTTYPPTGWAIINPDAGITWARNTAAAKTGIASAKLDFYNYTGSGQLDILRSPVVNFSTFDSAFVSFQYAYRQYDAPSSDTLEVVVSTDCGATWTSIWKKGGNDLTTVPGFQTAAFTPNAAQWTTSPVRINMGAYLLSGNLFVGFRSKNNFGNNLYIDDINIFGKNLPNYDARVSVIARPIANICDLPATPQVRVFNEGKITLTSVKVDYTVDGGTPVSQTFTGLNVLLAKDTLLTLAPITTLTAGAHVFRAYTSLPNTQVDQVPSNDTMSINTTYLVAKATPFTESFEGQTFPPTDWSISQTPVDAITWRQIKRPTIFATRDSAAAWMNNRGYTANDAVDNLISPLFAIPATDSVYFKFDLAAATIAYPGATAMPLDTLEVKVTKDCGASYTTIWKKWGWQLQTVNDANMPYVDTFVVKYANQWRTENINISNLLAGGGKARFIFTNTENRGNNIYIDNVNLFTKTLPAKVKQDGFMIAPNPFQNNFFVQHYLPPTELRGIGVYNAVGQQMMMLNYNGNADSYINVDMRRFAAGVYTVRLIYTNKTIASKVVKL